MRRMLRAVTAALALAACSHTHHVGQGGGEGAQQAPEHKQAQARARRVHPKPGEPAIADSPSGLMNPGSVRAIQGALQKKGYLEHASGELDPDTSAALRKFQHEEGLAQTGAPDRETLQHLGVDPNDVYRTVTPGKEKHPPSTER